MLSKSRYTATRSASASVMTPVSTIDRVAGSDSAPVAMQDASPAVFCAGGIPRNLKPGSRDAGEARREGTTTMSKRPRKTIPNARLTRTHPEFMYAWLPCMRTSTVSPLWASLTKWTVTICSRPSAGRHTPLQSEVNDPSGLRVLGPKIEVDQQSAISTRAGTPECCAHKPCPAQTIITRGSSAKTKTPRRPPRLRRLAAVRRVGGSGGGRKRFVRRGPCLAVGLSSPAQRGREMRRPRLRCNRVFPGAASRKLSRGPALA